ncbi:MAG: aminoglycoside 6-adenylyltransferase, partial [Armatimonadetes bacterium]|nr:aminoglycoside 6-adenylyltransferase [Armatimonadota bacterium]
MGQAMWQQKTIERIKEHLSRDEDVRGLVLIGSYTRDDLAPDAWSDADLVMIIRDEALSRFYPATDWLGDVGEIFCASQSSTTNYYVSRACFTDGRRIDFVIAAEGSLASIEQWEKNPLAYTNLCLFSCSPMLDKVLGMTFPPSALKPVASEDFERMANDFWFKGMLAVSKVWRDELLVALHLSLDMIRDCLVLGMMLRDRETGSDHHRDGAQGNRFVSTLERTRQPYTALGILDSIEQSAIVFDMAGGAWPPAELDRTSAQKPRGDIGMRRIVASLCVIATFAIAAGAFASDWDVKSDTWVATDALGRTLPGFKECGPPKKDKFVGIFYFLWLGQHSTTGPWDITKILAANPNDPQWGPANHFHH